MPRVRQISTEQDQITVAKLGDVVAHEPLSAAVDNQRQFVFGMEVPIERPTPAARPAAEEGGFTANLNMFPTGPHLISFYHQYRRSSCWTTIKYQFVPR